MRYKKSMFNCYIRWYFHSSIVLCISVYLEDGNGICVCIVYIAYEGYFTLERNGNCPQHLFDRLHNRSSKGASLHLPVSRGTAPFEILAMETGICLSNSFPV